MSLSSGTAALVTGRSSGGRNSSVIAEAVVSVHQQVSSAERASLPRRSIPYSREKDPNSVVYSAMLLGADPLMSSPRRNPAREVTAPYRLAEIRKGCRDRSPRTVRAAPPQHGVSPAPLPAGVIQRVLSPLGGRFGRPGRAGCGPARQRTRIRSETMSIPHSNGSDSQRTAGIRATSPVHLEKRCAVGTAVVHSLLSS
jgi:hypothetical protein